MVLSGDSSQYRIFWVIWERKQRHIIIISRQRVVISARISQLFVYGEFFDVLVFRVHRCIFIRCDLRRFIAAFCDVGSFLGWKLLVDAACARVLSEKTVGLVFFLKILSSDQDSFFSDFVMMGIHSDTELSNGSVELFSLWKFRCSNWVS